MGVNCGVKEMLVNGKKIEGNIIPVQKSDKEIEVFVKLG